MLPRYCSVERTLEAVADMNSKQTGLDSEQNVGPTKPKKKTPAVSYENGIQRKMLMYM